MAKLDGYGPALSLSVVATGAAVLAIAVGAAILSAVMHAVRPPAAPAGDDAEADAG